jgi:hypothetical protein
LLPQLLDGLSEFSNLSLQPLNPIPATIGSIGSRWTLLAQTFLEPLRYFREALGWLVKAGRVKVLYRDPHMVHPPFRVFR